jgi:hypothetical protein
MRVGVKSNNLLKKIKAVSLSQIYAPTGRHNTTYIVLIYIVLVHLPLV